MEAQIGTGAEAMRRALQGETGGPVPVAPLYLGLYLEPRRRLALAEVYRELATGDGELVLGFEQAVAARLAAWQRVWDALPERPHWTPVTPGPSRAALEGTRVALEGEHCFVFPPGAAEPATDLLAFYDNRHGDIWEQPGAPRTEAEVEALGPVPQPETWLDSGAAIEPRHLMERYGQEHLPVAACGSPFWVSHGLFGFAGLMTNLRENPRVLLKAAERYLQQMASYGQAVRAIGIPAMFVEECFTGSDLISRADYLRFCYPFTRDLLAALKETGLLVTFYHTGGVESRLDLLAALPCDAVAFEEGKKGLYLDLGRIRREIGPEKVLFGNLDVVLVRDGSEEEIAAEVQRQYRAAGPRYIVSPGSPLTLDTPPEKLGMLARAARGLRA